MDQFHMKSFESSFLVPVVGSRPISRIRGYGGYKWDDLGFYIAKKTKDLIVSFGISITGLIMNGEYLSISSIGQCVIRHRVNFQCNPTVIYFELPLGGAKVLIFPVITNAKLVNSLSQLGHCMIQGKKLHA